MTEDTARAATGDESVALATLERVTDELLALKAQLVQVAQEATQGLALVIERVIRVEAMQAHPGVTHRDEYARAAYIEAEQAKLAPVDAQPV